jgi:hypothetical protein
LLLFIEACFGLVYASAGQRAAPNSLNRPIRSDRAAVCGSVRTMATTVKILFGRIGLILPGAVLLDHQVSLIDYEAENNTGMHSLSMDPHRL